MIRPIPRWQKLRTIYPRVSSHSAKKTRIPYMTELVICIALILVLCAILVRKVTQPCDADRCVIRKCRAFFEQKKQVVSDQ